MPLKKFKHIDTFIFDVDGVLTDSSILIMEDGSLLRRMNVKDGYAIRTAINAGYTIIIITGGNSQSVRKRLNDLGVTEVFLKVEDKRSLVLELIKEQKIRPEASLYMGDDIIDLGAMALVTLATSPSDAISEVLAFSQYISPFAGGRGCVRDVIEKVMKVQGKWPLSQNYPDINATGINE